MRNLHSQKVESGASCYVAVNKTGTSPAVLLQTPLFSTRQGNTSTSNHTMKEINSFFGDIINPKDTDHASLHKVTSLNLHVWLSEG